MGVHMGANGYLRPLEIEAKNKIFLKTCSQLLIQINWFTYCNDCLFAYISGVGGVNVSALPKVLMRWKSLKIGKIRKNLGKICENLSKIPENLDKRYENTGKNGIQRALIKKKCHPTCFDLKKLAPNVCRITWKLFFSENVFREKIFSQKWNFGPSLRRFGQKSFPPHKICLCLHLWPIWPAHCTRAKFIIVVSCNDDIAVHWCLIFGLQRQAAELASGYLWVLIV